MSVEINYETFEIVVEVDFQEKGDTPYIGENGNWWISGIDTGVYAGDRQGGAVTKEQIIAALQYTPADEADLSEKVDKVNGKSLSDQNYTLIEKQKLEGLENYDDTDLQAEVANKVEKVTGKGLSEENYSTTEKSKLASLENFNDSGIQSQLGNKVDKEDGKGLSANDYTDDEKAKLAGLESSKYKGQFPSLQSLIDANLGEEGANAFVDEGEGHDVVNYIWDSTDEIWVSQQGDSTAETPSSVKAKYESNPDTNSFTDADKDKLEGVEIGATKNDTDANLKDRSKQTGEQAISTVTGLQAELDNKVVKEEGKGLSEQNYSLEEKNKLASITAIFTTNLKTAYDNVVTWISTNGENLLNHLTATNPHNITKNTIGLPNADNTSDADKPISTATKVYVDAGVIDQNTATGVEKVKFWTGTQSEYDAIPSKNAATLYFIK